MYEPYESRGKDYDFDFAGTTGKDPQNKEDLVVKIKQTREHLNFLKERLAAEKESLQLEIAASKQICEQVTSKLELLTSLPHRLSKSPAEINLQAPSSYPTPKFFQESFSYNEPYAVASLVPELNNLYQTSSVVQIPEFNRPAPTPSVLTCYPTDISLQQFCQNWEAALQHQPRQKNKPLEPIVHKQTYLSQEDYYKKLARDASLNARYQLYRGQLETVEKQCDHELNRMQDSISSIRNMRKYWEKNGGSGSGSMPNNPSLHDYHAGDYRKHRHHRSHSPQKKRSKCHNHSKKHHRTPSHGHEYFYADAAQFSGDSFKYY